MDHYGSESIRPIRWGSVTREASDRWRTSWRLELISVDRERLSEVVASAASEELRFRAELSSPDGHLLEVVVTTARDAMELDYYAETYSLFKLIDARVGRIETIQGSPRAWWQPFRPHG